MSQQTISQAQAIYDSLDGYEAMALLPWDVAKIVNALVQKAKSEAQGDPMLDAIAEFKAGPNDKFAEGVQVGTARAVLKTIWSVVPD